MCKCGCERCVCVCVARDEVWGLREEVCDALLRFVEVRGLDAWDRIG